MADSTATRRAVRDHLVLAVSLHTALATHQELDGFDALDSPYAVSLPAVLPGAEQVPGAPEDAGPGAAQETSESAPPARAAAALGEGEISTPEWRRPVPSPSTS